MEDNYAVDLTKFPLEKFKTILQTKELLPGRVILKEKLEERFNILKANGVNFLQDLLDVLKSKTHVISFSKQTTLGEEYLTVLKREAKSYVSTPVKLSVFPGIDKTILEQLEAKGIKNSKQFFESASTVENRQKLAEKLSLTVESLNELISLCDLVRITGVGPIFARIVYDSGYPSIKEFLEEETKVLLDKLRKTNTEKGLTKVKFAEKDIEYCKVLGGELKQTIEL